MFSHHIMHILCFDAETRIPTYHVLKAIEILTMEYGIEKSLLFIQ